MEFGVGIKFHGTFEVPWNSMELPFWPGKVPWNSMEFHGTSGEFHGIPWNSMELWNIDINKFHNWGSIFHCFLYDFMSLYIRQSIGSWNIEIFQFQSNFLVPLMLVKWRYSILNGGLLIEHVTIGYVYVKFIASTRIFYQGVPGFAIGWPCGVWSHRLTIASCMLVNFV